MTQYSAKLIAVTVASLLSIQGCITTDTSTRISTASPTPTPTTSPDKSTSQNSNTKPQNRVKVFFPNPEQAQGDLSYVEPVWRRTDSVGVGAFAIAQLIAGPTASEKELGLDSALTLRGQSNCSGEDFQLSIADKVAKLQFCRDVISAGVGDDARAQSAITATLKQFNTVDTVVILNAQGNCLGDLSGDNPCFNQLPNSSSKSPDNNTRLALTRFGPIEIGMTVAQASQAAGILLQQQTSGGEEHGCLYYDIEPSLEGVAFMVTENRIARIDIYSETITTLSGAGIGSTEAEIRQLYSGKIESEVHPYDPNGKYLTFVPQDAKHRNYRVIFETDGSNTVQRFRSGQLPEVGWIEGCG